MSLRGEAIKANDEVWFNNKTCNMKVIIDGVEYAKVEKKEEEMTLIQLRSSGRLMVSGGNSNRDKLQAIRDMILVADYLNGEWKPIWDKSNLNYSITIDNDNVRYSNWAYINTVFVYFKSKEVALKAIEMLGEDTIKTALL